MSNEFVDAEALGLKLTSVQDAVDWVALCGQHGQQNLLASEGCLDDAFFDLRTGLAGEVLQKWMNYQLRVAMVVEDPRGYGPRVAELVREHATHPRLRFFPDRASAVAWLSS